MVVRYYQELAESDAPITVSYEQSWSGALVTALNDALLSDCQRGRPALVPSVMMSV